MKQLFKIKNRERELDKEAQKLRDEITDKEIVIKAKKETRAAVKA